MSPQSILINADDPNRLRLKVFNWQVGYRDGGATTGVSQPVSATSHVDRLVEDAARPTWPQKPYPTTAPLASISTCSRWARSPITSFPASGPQRTDLELSNKLRETKGLQISSVLNGAGETLQEMIHWATHADVGQRVGLISTVDDFVDLLDKVEEEATTPES